MQELSTHLSPFYQPLNVYKVNEIFMRRQSMYQIRTGIQSNGDAFPDTSILGNFLDNHDNPQFLSGNPDWTLLKNGLAYIMFSEVTT